MADQPKGDPKEVLAEYVLGGWSRTVNDERELLAAIEEGMERSPIAAVTVRFYIKTIPLTQGYLLSLWALR